MEWKEKDGWLVSPSLSWPQPNTAQAKANPPVQMKAPTERSVLPCHARPDCSPEDSPDLHKLGSTVQHSTHSMPYMEKKRFLEKQEEIQEVKRLDEWKPPEDIFVTVLVGLDDKDA